MKRRLLERLRNWLDPDRERNMEELARTADTRSGTAYTRDLANISREQTNSMGRWRTVCR